MLSSLFSENFVISMAKPAQYGFQPAYSPIMEGIIDLHHYICFFLVGILTFVVWMLFYTVFQYSYISLRSTNSVFKKKKLSYLSNFFRTIGNSIGRVDYKNARNLSHWTALEVIWTILPSFILLSIAIPSFILLYSMDELTDDVAITIKVVGHQWYWSYQFSNPSFVNFIENNDPNTFCYDSYMVPWETSSLNDTNLKNSASLRLLQVDKPLWLPIKTHIRFMITSADVIHSWAVPALGVKVDAVPGRLNQTFLFINQSGRFFGQCSEICGANHGFMPIEIIAVPWEHWSKFFENGFKV
jgi:cytochrome c oxidase subunit 2